MIAHILPFKCSLVIYWAVYSNSNSKGLIGFMVGIALFIEYWLIKGCSSASWRVILFDGSNRNIFSTKSPPSAERSYKKSLFPYLSCSNKPTKNSWMSSLKPDILSNLKPVNFIINSHWWVELLPGNNGFPKSISPIKHPILHMSTA